MVGTGGSHPHTLCMFETFHSKTFFKIAKGNSPNQETVKWPQGPPTKNSSSSTGVATEKKIATTIAS